MVGVWAEQQFVAYVFFALLSFSFFPSTSSTLGWHESLHAQSVWKASQGDGLDCCAFIPRLTPPVREVLSHRKQQSQIPPSYNQCWFVVGCVLQVNAGIKSPKA